MPKYCSIGTVGVRQTKEAGSRNVQREVFFNPDSDHTITHKGVRYAVFVSKEHQRAIIHELKDETGAVIKAEATIFAVASPAAAFGTPVALEVDFVNATAEVAKKAAADVKNRLRLVGITAPAP